MAFQNLRLFFVGLNQVPQREEPLTAKGWAAATHESMNSIFVHPTLGPYEFSEVTYYFDKAPTARIWRRFRIDLKSENGSNQYGA